MLGRENKITFVFAVLVINNRYALALLQSSDGVALWSSAGTGAAGAGATVRASADVWQLRSVFNSTTE